MAFIEANLRPIGRNSQLGKTMWFYINVADTRATISAVDYFNATDNSLALDDLIMCQGSDGPVTLGIESIGGGGGVTTTPTSGTGGGGVDVLDEGSLILAAASALNFIGAGVSSVINGATPTQVDITIPGGGGGGQFVNPDDFGAAGNGTTDDTAAIQSALNAAIGQGLLFTRAGPYLVNGVLSIPGPMSIWAVGNAKINFTGTNGCFQVTGTNLPWLEMVGLEISYTGTATGAIGRIGLITTNDITRQGFNADPAAGIDHLSIRHCIFRSCKLAISMLDSDEVDLLYNKILYENPNVRSNPYALLFRKAGNGPMQNVRVIGNFIRAHNEDDGTINTGGGAVPRDNMDLIKWLGGAASGAPRQPLFAFNHVDILNPETGNSQMDTFFGGSGIRMIGNYCKDLNIHTKGDDANLQWTSHRQPIYVGNAFKFTVNATPGGSDAQRRSHAPLFLRGGGLHIVVGNQFEILPTNRGTNAIRLDNNINNFTGGWPHNDTDGPVQPAFVGNSCVLFGRTDHRFIDADPSNVGNTSTMVLVGNSVVSAVGQSVDVVQAGSWNAAVLGNQQSGPGNWNLATVSNNPGVTLV